MDGKEMRNFSEKFYSNYYSQNVKTALDTYNDIKQKTGDNIINRGLLVLSTSIFESTINDTLEKFYYIYPFHLGGKEIKIETSKLREINEYGIDIIIEQETNKISRKSLREQAINFSNTIIGKKKNDTNVAELYSIINDIDRISNLRNKITHSWKQLKETEVGNKELISCIEILEKFLKLSNDLIEKKYPQKTRINQLIDVWNKTMQSPILKFDNYWNYDLVNDIITGIKYSDNEKFLSTSEAIKLSYWRYNYNATKEFEPIPFAAYSLDKRSLKQIYLINSVFQDTEFYYMFSQYKNN